MDYIKTVELHGMIREFLIYNLTRSSNLNSNEPNYAEVINDLFVTQEFNRSFWSRLEALDENVYDLESLKTLRKAKESMPLVITKVGEFLSSWSTAYTSWLGSYKSAQTSRELFRSGNEYVHLDYQSNFPNIKKMNDDFMKLVDTLSTLSKELFNLAEEMKDRLLIASVNNSATDVKNTVTVMSLNVFKLSAVSMMTMQCLVLVLGILYGLITDTTTATLFLTVIAIQILGSVITLLYSIFKPSTNSGE